MISSILAPVSRFSNTVATGIRVPRKTQAPLTFSGELSTASRQKGGSIGMSANKKIPALDDLSAGFFAGVGFGA
jgi:hypothetical protein